MVPRAVACFTFDNMAEAADVGTGAHREGAVHPSLAIGYPNLYRLLAAHEIRATFFVEGWNGVHHSEAVAEIVRRGHELGMHRWLRALACVAEHDGLFVLICHAFITGIDPERLAALDAVMHAARSDPRIAIRTTAAVAQDLIANLEGEDRCPIDPASRPA